MYVGSYALMANQAKISPGMAIFEFGNIDQGDIERTIQLKNTGDLPLIIEKIKTENEFFKVEWPKEPIKPGAMFNLTIKLNARKTYGTKRYPISVYSNATNSPNTFVIRCNGLPTPILEQNNKLLSEIEFPGFESARVGNRIILEQKGKAGELYFTRIPLKYIGEDSISYRYKLKDTKKTEGNSYGNYRYHVSQRRNIAGFCKKGETRLLEISGRRPVNCIGVHTEVIDLYIGRTGSGPEVSMELYLEIHWNIEKTEFSKLKSSSGLPYLYFPYQTFDFGNIDQGDRARHDFKFTNIGSYPLILSNVMSSCGCVSTSWPRQPILPGETGEITVIFNTSGKAGRQNKTVTIVSNNPNGNQRVNIMANVIVPNKLDEDNAPRRGIKHDGHPVYRKVKVDTAKLKRKITDSTGYIQWEVRQLGVDLGQDKWEYSFLLNYRNTGRTTLEIGNKFLKQLTYSNTGYASDVKFSSFSTNVLKPREEGSVKVSFSIKRGIHIGQYYVKPEVNIGSLSLPCLNCNELGNKVEIYGKLPLYEVK